ncbi:AraC family transcriptional regulator [Sphaerisporangium sp. TRM90804]|uniref:AraC family transcriptional regulator n=1 Tax=Sphaerisporangium sp. TRM90804 TaxID=3031113 RepID=UPI00244AF445|nr:AraC family transcriptional regulator [Sphaerisporangium sp. TRM90804]MDH2427475.1 AraC family transcriptional regulator [Sphaerisporangium sp. TRM90804]
MFESADFDLAPYAGLDAAAYVRHTYNSWDDVGWRSLLVQGFTHAAEAEHVPLPAVSDLHLVLCVAGNADMSIHTGGKPVRRRWVPGHLELMVPGRATSMSYRATSRLSTIQVHIPSLTVKRTTGALGGREPDFEALSAALRAGDPVVEQLLRSLAGASGVSDLYAESAAAFLSTHVLTAGRNERLPGPEHAAVRAGVAIMRERLAEPLTLATIAAEVHLSVYHFVRVFREATGQTPHRYLIQLRIERARRLLVTTSLSVEQIAGRCGFASPGALSSAFLRHTGVRPSAYRKN